MINSIKAVGAMLLSLSLATLPAQSSQFNIAEGQEKHVKNQGVRQTGVASFYSDWYNGRPMANGRLFYNSSNSCAHRTLKFGTIVTIRNPANGKTVKCVVRDRGPFVSGRVIDLSKTTFNQLAPLSRGVINVELSW